MLKLIRSDMLRILKSPPFWICNGLYILYGIILLLSFFIKFNFILDFYYNIGLSGSPLTGLVIAIVVSILIGSDFNKNSIQDKIVMGYSKTQIYMSKVIAFSICAIIINLIFLCFSILPTFGFIYVIEAIFFENFSATAVLVVWAIAENIVTVIFFVSIYTFLAMKIKNPVLSAVCGVILNIAAVLSSICILQNEANPTLYGIIYLFPSGINTFLAEGYFVIDWVTIPYLGISVSALALLLSTIINCIGAAIFKKSKIT